MRTKFIMTRDMQTKDYAVYKQKEGLYQVFMQKIADNTFLVKGFKGRADKVSFFYKFTSSKVAGVEFTAKERIDNFVDAWIERIELQQADKIGRRASVSKLPRAEIGDIFVSSWGYDQTNVDYFQVVGTPSKCFVEVKEIAQQAVSGSEGMMSSQVMPIKDKFIKGWKLDGKEVRVRSAGDYIKVGDYSAKKFDGTSNYCSWYA